jgi:hypothetical protein
MDYSFDVARDALKLTKGWIFEDIGNYDSFRFRHIETNMYVTCALPGRDVPGRFCNIMFGEGVTVVFSYTVEKISENLDAISLLISDVGEYSSWYHQLCGGDYTISKNSLFDALHIYRIDYECDDTRKAYAYEYENVLYYWNFHEDNVILSVNSIHYIIPYCSVGSSDFPILPNKMMRELKLNFLT